MPQVWKLSATDLCEIAGNSVAHSGFPHQVRTHNLSVVALLLESFLEVQRLQLQAWTWGAVMFWITIAACTMLMLGSQGC